MTPLVQTAVKSGAGQIHMVGDEPCTPDLQGDRITRREAADHLAVELCQRGRRQADPRRLPGHRRHGLRRQAPTWTTTSCSRRYWTRRGVGADQEDGFTAYWAILSLQRALSCTTAYLPLHDHRAAQQDARTGDVDAERGTSAAPNPSRSRPYVLVRRAERRTEIRTAPSARSSPRRHPALQDARPVALSHNQFRELGVTTHVTPGLRIVVPTSLRGPRRW